MYLEHFWLSITGIFLSGALFMFGVLMAIDARRQARKPRVPLTRGYDPRNPINRMGELSRQFASEEDGWFEVKPVDWR